VDERYTQKITLIGSNLNANQQPDIADLPVGGLDWSDMAREAGSYPCHPAPHTRKSLLRMGLPNTGREGSKFWKLRKDTFMEIIICQSGGKNKSLQKLPPSLPVPIGGFCTNRKAATRKFGTRLVNRTKRVAAKSIAAIPAESIPFIWVAVVIVDTGYELYAACETVRDLDQLYVDLGMADEVPGDAVHGVCDPELPDAGEVWGGVVENMGQWRESLVEAV
jgi:hypothetical protein